MLKKIMSFTLSLILAASCFTFSVSAAPGDSASDPFIYTENFDVVDNDDLYSKFKPVSNGGIGDYSVSQETSVVEDEVDFSTHGKVWLMKSNVTAGGNNGQKAYYRRYEETPRRDVEIEFDMRTNAPNNERPMVFLRTDARPDSGYAVRLGNETVALQSEDSGGGEFVIATVETRGESWHHYKITAIGKEIKVYRDDKLVLEYNEAKEMAGGIAFGGWYHSVWIDNLSVKLYGPSTPLYANNFEEAKFPLRGFTTPSNGTGSNQYAQNQVSQVVQSDDTTYGNVWKLNNGSSQAYYKRYELNLTDLVMDFDLKTNANGTTASGQRPVAYVRSNGNTNSGYAAQLFEDGIRIISIDSNETAVATGLYSAFSGATSRGTDWRHYRITAIGNVISAYRTDISEDVPIVSYTIKEADSPKYLGAGAIAFAGWNHESFIDNLVVASPSVANNTTVFDSDFSDDAVINQFTGATNGIGVYSGNQISAIVDGGAGHEAAWKLSSALTTKGNTAQANQAYYKKFEPSPLLRDVEVEFDLKTGIAGTATSLTSQTGERPSVYVRTNNNGDSGYSVQLYDNGIRIVAEGGSPVAIGFYDANNNRGTDWRHYKVTAIGDTISAYRTDISATDPVVFYTIKDSDPVKFTEAGGIAFGGWWHEAFIDNLKITGVSAAVVDEVEFFDNFDAYKDPLAVFENASGGIEDYAQGEVSELASETQGKSYYLGSESRNASGNRQAYYRRYVSEYLNLDLKFDLKTNADPSATEQTPFVYIRPPIGSSGDAGYVVMLFESKVEIWLGSTVLQTAELSPSRGNDWREYRITAVDKVLSVYRLDISEDDPIITYDGLNVVEGGGFGFGGWRHSVWIDNIEAKLWGTPPPAEFELNRTEARLSIGDAITLSPLYDDVRSKPSSFTFVSADETVATVDSAGVVYAKSEGTAVITATDRNTISRTCKITVNAPCNTFIYVSTTGDDLLGDGTEDNPFATIQRAQTEVRNLSSLPDGGVTVYLKGGWYYVDEPLQFAKEDSGEAGKPVVYASAPGGEKAAIHSGRTISGFRSLEENDKPVGLKDSVRSNVYVADVDPGWRFHDLYANGVRQQVARQINSSDYLTWNKFVRPIDKPFDQRTTNDGAAKGMELKFVTGDLNDLPNNGDLEVNYLPEVYWNSLAVLGDINAANGTARLRSLNPAIETGYWGNNVFSKFDGGGAYNIMNAPRDLDAAGEWCIDSKAGKVYWWPLNASDLESAVAPRAFELLRIQGSDKSRVEYLEFRNLNFMYTDRLPEDQWAEDPSDPKGLVVRNAENPDAAIFMQGVSNCVIADSAVIHTGSYAIALDHYAQNNLILRNNLEDLGCGGVQIYGYGPGITHPNNHNVVLGNYIKDVGLAPYQHSAAVTVYAAGYNDIKFNKFENMPYVAISIVGAAPDALGAGPSDTPVAGVSSFTDTFGNLGTQYGVQWDEIKATDAYTSGALKSRNLKAAQPLQGSSNNVAEYNIALEYALLMNDTGAYYSWSPGKGGEYNYSIARKTGKSKDMCWPFYLDDMSEDMKVEGNAVWAPQSNPHTKNQSTSVWKNNTWSNSETPAYTDLLAKIVAGASSLGKSFTKYGGDQLPSYALLVEGGAASATSSPDSAQITVTADNASFSKWELVDFIEGDSNLKYGTDSADAVDGLSLDDVKEKITTFLMPRHAVKLKAVAKSIPTKADLDYDIAEVVTDGKDILARTIFDGSAKSVPVEAKSAGLGEITVKYYELGGSDPVEPVDAGEYLVKVATVETTDFYAAGSKSSDGTEVPEIEIGLLVIEKATVLDISKEVFAREQLAKEYQQDLASLIPVDVASKGLEIAYAMSFSDTPGFLSNPSLDGSVLSLPVEATAYADGIKETVEVIVTIKNYKDFTISVIVKLSEKIAVTVDADAPDRDYNTQPYDGIGEPTFTDSAGNAVNLELPYTIDYYDSDGAKLSSAPTDAGSYKAVITVNHVDYCGSVEKPFKIKPAPVIITAAVVGGTYDGTPRTVSPTFADQSGDAVNPNFKVTYYQVIGEAETALGSAPSDAGEYKAVVLVEDDNYDGTRTVTFTIAKAKLTVTANNVTIRVGETVPATFDYVVDGFLDSESLVVAPVLTCAIANSNKPGSYLIIVSGGTAPANYEIGSRVNGTLLVTGKETVSITAAVVGGTYDGTPRTVSPTFADQSGDAVN
ncbi:MAG: MBG domain-containing protein, partial [Clostridiales bacterium]|nr:MBG domain-containing protein [Clostridiales bacterium]